MRSQRWPWIVGATAALLLGLLLIGWWRSGPVDIPQPVVDVEPPPRQPDPPPEPVPALPPESVASRLEALGVRINRVTALHDRFPQAAGLLELPEPLQRMSWLAELELDRADFPASRRPVRDRPWNDPANEPFVGRQIPAFLDPTSADVVGPDGRPVTHFVGVAGVGRDAPELPRHHPRAGLFGWTRTVRTEDVKDGLSSTLMVLGVESQRGSWAEPGPSTVRALTAPPYVRGPDGFGTGSPDAMLALMADGGVRNIAAGIDPVLMRRMAAMADGFPLDVGIPGEPGDRPPGTSRSTGFDLAQVDPDAPPVSALSTQQPLPTATIVRPAPAAVLGQTLGLFEQAKPVARRTLLTVAEDLFDRPLRLPAAGLGGAERSLDQTVTLKLTNATVEQVLTELLAGTELELVIAEETLQLERRAAGAPAVRIAVKPDAE